MKTSIIIPIYNEEKLLPEVLRRVRALPFEKELVLVDDCSQDGTPELLKKEAEYDDTQVVTHSINQGKGMAIRSGLEFASGEIIIIQDADLEYRPEDIESVIQPIIDGKTNVCYGSRFLGSVKGMRIPNYVANQLLAVGASILYGQKITDEATAYKAFRADIIHKITLTCKRFEFCPEVTAKVRRIGEPIMEVPVTFVARTFEEGKKIGWRDFFVAVDTLLRCRFQKKEEFVKKSE